MGQLSRTDTVESGTTGRGIVVAGFSSSQFMMGALVATMLLVYFSIRMKQRVQIPKKSVIIERTIIHYALFDSCFKGTWQLAQSQWSQALCIYMSIVDNFSPGRQYSAN